MQSFFMSTFPAHGNPILTFFKIQRDHAKVCRVEEASELLRRRIRQIIVCDFRTDTCGQIVTPIDLREEEERTAPPYDACDFL